MVGVWKKNVMTTAVIFRVHTKATTVLAELAFAVTLKKYRRTGSLKVLRVELEFFLRLLKVKKLVLPALSKALYIWV